MGFHTAKWIEIPDTKLGRLFNALLALLLCVVVYKSVYNKAFLEYDTPVGFVNAKITDWKAPETTPAYCTSKIPCRVLDEYQAQYPTTEGDSITLTTRVKEVVDEQQQNGTWARKSSKSFFTEGAEQFVIKLEHSFEAPHFFKDAASASEMESKSRLYAGSSRNMQGVLKHANGKERVMPSATADKFTIGELVEAAGVDLEQTSDGKADEDEDIRSRGMVLMMHITYTNIDKGKFSIQQPTYKYKIHKVPYAEYKAAQPFGRSETSDSSGATRTLWKRYGIRVIFVQTGRIARFSWNALLMEIVAGLTLLSVAQLVCDTYAYYFRPELKKLMSVQEYSNTHQPAKDAKPKSEKPGKKD